MGEVTSEERIVAGFGHLMIVFGLMGIAVALVIWIVKKESSEFIKKSVKQAVAYQAVALTALQFLSGPRIGLFLTVKRNPVVSQTFNVIWILATMAIMAYGVWGAMNAFKGKKFKYALIGDFVDRILN